MRKTGQSTTIDPMMWLIIGIVTLAGIGFFVYLGFSAENNFFKEISDFNLKNEKQKPIGIIGYDLENDALKYYDGGKWIDFPKEGLTYDGKKYEKNEVYDDLVNRYWYNLEKRGDRDLMEIGGSDLNLIYPIVKYPFVGSIAPFILRVNEIQRSSSTRPFGSNSFLSRKYGRISSNLYSKSSQENDVFGGVILDADNSFRFYPMLNEPVIRGPSINPEVGFGDDRPIRDETIRTIYFDSSSTNFLLESSNPAFTKIKNGIIGWRDSILKKPVSINVGGASEQYCVEKIDNVLVVRLNKPYSGESCNG